MATSTVPASSGALADALRYGPFHEALRLAIRASGLTLERLEDRLRRRGLRVSIATLSYWQRGQARPRRAGSRTAVAALEEILGLPAGALLALLDNLDGAGNSGNALARLAQILGSPGIDRLAVDTVGRVANYTRPVSVRQECVMSAARILRSECTSAIREAQHDAVDRTCCLTARDNRVLPVRWHSDTHRIGRVREDREHGALVAELLLDPPLNRGECGLVEFGVEYAEPAGRLDPAKWDLNWGFGSTAGLREYYLRVLFDPADLPRRVVRFAQSPRAGDVRDLAEIPLAADGTARFVAFDVPPGFVGLRWEY